MEVSVPKPIKEFGRYSALSRQETETASRNFSRANHRTSAGERGGNKSAMTNYSGNDDLRKSLKSQGYKRVKNPMTRSIHRKADESIMSNMEQQEDYNTLQADAKPSVGCTVIKKDKPRMKSAAGF